MRRNDRDQQDAVRGPKAEPTGTFVGNGVDVTYPPSAKALRQEILRQGVLPSEHPSARKQT